MSRRWRRRRRRGPSRRSEQCSRSKERQKRQTTTRHHEAKKRRLLRETLGDHITCKPRKWRSHGCKQLSREGPTRETHGTRTLERAICGLEGVQQRATRVTRLEAVGGRVRIQRVWLQADAVTCWLLAAWLSGSFLARIQAGKPLAMCTPYSLHNLPRVDHSRFTSCGVDSWFKPGHVQSFAVT